MAVPIEPQFCGIHSKSPLKNERCVKCQRHIVIFTEPMHTLENRRKMIPIGMAITAIFVVIFFTLLILTQPGLTLFAPMFGILFAIIVIPLEIKRANKVNNLIKQTGYITCSKCNRKMSPLAKCCIYCGEYFSYLTK